MQHLGILYMSTSRETKALEIILAGYNKSKQAYGEEHLETLPFLLLLGSIYKKLGKYDEAELALSACYKARKQLLGEKHPDTFTTLKVLAAVTKAKKDDPNYVSSTATATDAAAGTCSVM
jgi:hypothetical protein